ncbi:RagB/SusD family nutrient uptake outer membrane protein [Pedobacter fastidiosus]|uniref:RagB/SusD family nutrient uptake outer membrane protein n=1 Tax=Pedobacter fastidiosus TaxID=2765361 RepID=A0ABR7KQA6_9SPHI|nr:RagB/SusD family nutrient uptake outer membrane protein [Pedobacter fastidiosus]MBC6110252.1 RagB/SusD family nutrient uptake outer membrane protein [Pedobacter fastidiosus]
MKNRYIMFTMIATILGASSCKKTLKTEPKNSISSNVALQEAAGVEGLVNSLYESLQSTTYYGRNFIVVPELLSDNMRIVNTNSNRFVSESNNTIAATVDLWTAGYSAINRANGVLKYSELVTGLTPLRKKQLQGEAYFIRALVYFDLVKSYGYNPQQIVSGRNLGVPITLDFVENYPADIKYPTRNTVQEVYTQIKTDLTSAIGLLDNTFAPKRVSLAAANALRSRVALFNGDWADAATFATTALTSGVGAFVDPASATTPALKSASYATIFTSPSSPESIFELNFEITESAGSDGLSSIYTRSTVGLPPSLAGSGYGDAAPQANLVATYETGDVRKDLLFAITKGSEAILWNQKYPAAKGPQIDNVKLIRVSEMILTRAEANFRNGTAIGASPQADLDRIRLRAGLISVPVTLDAILKERRIELAYEGHRYWDLLRTGSAINKSTTTLPANATPSTIIPFTDFRLLARIPLTEVQNNPNIIQNTGY